MKAKLTLTFEMEYELDPSAYPEGMTPEEMVALDAANYSYCYDMLIDNDKTKMTMKGELL